MKWNGAFLFERQQTVFRSFAPAPIPQRECRYLFCFTTRNGMEYTTTTTGSKETLSLEQWLTTRNTAALVVACQDTHEFSCREVARQFQLEKYLYSHTCEDTLFYSTTLFIRGVLKNYRVNSTDWASKTEKTFHCRDFCPKH